MSELIEQNSHFLTFIFNHFLGEPLTTESALILFEDEARLVQEELNILEQVDATVIGVGLTRYSDGVERYIKIIQLNLAEFKGIE